MVNLVSLNLLNSYWNHTIYIFSPSTLFFLSQQSILILIFIKYPVIDNVCPKAGSVMR